jgi:hypothetical protein
MQEEVKTEVRKRSWPRRVGRILLKTILFIFLFIILVFLLILTPPVQRFLTGKVQNYLEKKLQTTVRIGRIGFGLSGDIALQNIYIEDKTKDTLISGGALKAHINFMKLFSHEVEVKDIELQNIVAKVKRVLPDTVFNYQFIVNAFTSEQKKNPDTAQTAPMKLNISDVTLDNVALTYTDAVTGVDMFGRVGYATTTIDTLDPYTQTFNFPSLILRNTTVRMKQTKPLLEPKPMAVDVAEAQTPPPMHLSFGTIDLTKVAVQYDNDVSALYSNISIGKAKVDGKMLDLPHNKIYLDELSLANTLAAVRLGKSPGAQVVKQQTKQEVAAQSTVPWDFRVDKIRFDNANIRFDDDNKPQLSYGMDYSHLKADSVTLYANNFVMSPDSTGLTITKGYMREKSGFVLTTLQGDIFYGNNQTSIKNLLVKTPGSEFKRSAVIQYASLEELQKHFDRAVFDFDIDNSYAQVKDILIFAPQLRSQPAFRNPNEVWHFNLVGHGTMDKLDIAKLQFSGLQNTQLNASGTLMGLANPNNAGGNFNIYRLHTTKSDLNLLSGNALAGQPIDLPQTLDLSGLVSGNAGRLHTNLTLNTTDGDVNLNGSFANLMNPTALSYNANMRASGLRLGKILKQQGQIGNLTGSFAVNGHGITPNTINTTFRVNINNVGYNHYSYRNIRMNGSLRKTVFNVNADVADPNVDVTLSASGDYAAYGPFKINADIDSVKAQNLGFSTEPLIFRGKINGTADKLNSDYPTANILLTQALVVSGTNRLSLDSLQILAGHDTENYLTLKSDIASAELRGQYKLMDLGNIIQSNLAPYFSPATATAKPVPAVAPYDIRFKADLIFSPALQAFVPDLKRAENVHAEGSLATGQGLNALITAPAIEYQTDVINNLQARINTNDSGLHVNATMDRLKAAGLDVYATRLNATALHNNVNFSVGIDDKNKRNKYLFGGLVTMAPDGNTTIHLSPDSLRLNYDMWTMSPNNSIIIGKGILANDFVLSKGGQQLSIQSQGTAENSPLDVRFTNFRIGTLTAFLKPDTTLVDGVLNGRATFTDLTKQPLFTTDLTVTDLQFRQDTVGNLNAKISSSGNTYTTNVTLTGKGNDLALTGTVSPQGQDVAFDLNLAIRQFQLNTFQGALKDFVTSATGAINGSVSLRGTTSAPKIDGRLNFDNVAISTLAIGGPFKVDKESLVVVSNKGLEFNSFTIRDSADNALNISGLVGTTNFVNYDFDLNIRARNFQAVNVARRQGNIYWGKLILSTNLHVGGTEAAPVVDGNLSVNDSTDFSIVIPQTDPGVVSRKGVVQFVDFKNPQNDSLFLANYDSLNHSVLTGYDISTNITVSKNAKFTVIIDEANGDFVDLQGEANLSAGIDPSGKINLTGSYQVEKGAYQLSYNFIQRRFDLQKGSRIDWLGDPTSATLNMTAVYIANTAPLDLVSDYISATNAAIRNTYLQKLPFQVLLTLQGQLMQPKISFDIQLPTDRSYGVSNDIITNVDTRLTQLRQEPSELNKQVFALLLLGRFVGENPFQSSGDGGGFNAGAYAMQSVSKLLTDQLNNLAQSLISGVDLNFNVTSSDDYTTGERRERTDLNVGLTKNLLSNRLSVTVGSNFELQGPQQGTQGSNNLAGNIAVNYQLSRDGRYMLRFYRRNDYFGVVDGYVIETGLRFIITLDYNRFADLFRRKKLRVDNKDTQNQEGK